MISYTFFNFVLYKNVIYLSIYFIYRSFIMGFGSGIKLGDEQFLKFLNVVSVSGGGGGGVNCR